MKLKVELHLKDRPHFENWEVEDIAAAKKRIAEIEGIVSAVIYDLKTGEIADYKPTTMTAEQIVRELAEWSRKYPRGQIYAMSGNDNMDARLIEIEEMAKEYAASSAVQEAEKPAGGELSGISGQLEQAPSAGVSNNVREAIIALENQLSTLWMELPKARIMELKEPLNAVKAALSLPSFGEPTKK